MRRLIAIALVGALGGGAARAATPVQVICASYQRALAKEPNRAKRDAMIKSLPRGCEVKEAPRKPAAARVRTAPPARPAETPVPLAAQPEAPVPMPTAAPVQAPPLPPLKLEPMPRGVTIEAAHKAGNKAYQQGKYAEAMKWFRMAADHGDAAAQSDMGELYFHGHGVQIDYAEAMVWYRRAAAQGNATAQDSIGALYARGQGVGVNYAEAMKWFRLAAAQGYADAANWIGYFYSHGLGVPNESQAQTWYAKARADQKPR